MKLSQLAVDTGKSEDGVWFEYPHFEGVSFLIARMGNSSFSDYLQKHRKLSRTLRSDSEMMDTLTKKAVAETVLLNWRGIEDDNGEPLQYTPEIGFETFQNESMQPVYSFILQSASDMEAFQVEEEQEDTGNSLSGSNGSLESVAATTH